jgi:hypothetical protein
VDLCAAVRYNRRADSYHTSYRTNLHEQGVKGTAKVNEPIEHFDRLESYILLILLEFRADHDLDVDDRDQNNLVRELATAARHIVKEG